MKNRKSSPRGIRARWVVIAIAALLVPAMLLWARGRAQVKKQAQGSTQSGKSVSPPNPLPPSQEGQTPDVVPMVGPVSQDQDLRALPDIPAGTEEEEELRRRHPFPLPGATGAQRPMAQPETFAPGTDMPAPSNSFDAIDSNASGCGCLPPDTDGDVGPNNYIASENSSIRIHDKTGNVLAGPISYNAFFSAMGTSTPCGSNANDGDGIVFYDHIADRWVVSDFAFPAFPGTSFYQCVGVSKTSDPVAGGWYLYAIQVDPAHNNYLGDYPKFGMWPDGYYLSMNEFSTNTTFNGVRVYALDRNAMINGGSANGIGFSILPADLGDQYSLVPASFRTGDAPPAGQPEWFMDINSSAAAGTVENQVFVRRFHADFVTPANSTFGVGATHTPDGTITVNGFKDAYTTTTSNIVPNGTATTSQWIDTLGDKLMYPLIYQNRGGAESIYAVHTTAPSLSGDGSTNGGPTAVTWYQFNMTGNTIPGTPVQQQDWMNGNDGLFRSMPSINVDNQGNVAIGYTAASTTVNPGVRWAGRLTTDPLNNMSQGEAVMYAATGHQTDTSGRWGDYSSMFVDPSDSCTFYHTNEYYSVTSGAGWRTRVGAFKFAQCSGSPLPTPTPSATPTPTATPTPPTSAGPVTVTASAGTAGPTDYATVKAAFDAINLGTHQGAINVAILGDTVETVAAVLNASGSGSASYTSIFIAPSGARTVSGNLATPLIDLNGAKNVTVNGSNSGGNSLTLTNTNTGTTTGTSTIRFINGASNNTVKNCSILGSATVSVGTAGGNVLFSTTTGTGNNNNTVSGNNIGPAGVNLPVKAVSAVGTTTNSNTINTGDVIDNNNIFDFFIATANTTGVDIRAGNNGFTVSNNRIYQTAPRTFTTAASRYAGITFSGTTGANGNFMTITGNIIGFGAANGTGTTTITGSSNEFRGIDILGASTSTATSIQGNTISGINQTSSRASITTGLACFAGIQVSTSAGASATAAVDVGTVTGNTIGSLDGSSTIVINATSTTASTTPAFGILTFDGSSNNISNNKIGAITIQSTGTVTGFRGIFPGATAATTQIVSNNIIGGPTAAGGITDTQTGNYALYGIQASTASGVITGNVIRNLVGNANVAGSVNESGIAFTSTSTTAVSVISGNTIYNLSNSSGAVATNIYGLDVTMSTTAAVTGNLVERNFIHSLSVTSTDATSQIYGLIVRGGNTTGTATATIQNNMIRLGLDGSGNPITTGFLIRGIRDSAAGAGGNVNNSYYYNSIYIGGAGVVSSSNSTAFFSDQVTSATSPRVIRNNIFWNARSNASGAGKNYAIAVGGTAPNPPGLTSNRNDLYATGTGGFVGLFNAVDQTTLANWQTATGQDANSISADPKFVAPNGTATSVNLHLTGGSACLGAGTAVTTTIASPLTGITGDFDTQTRDFAPDIGADEFGNAIVADFDGDQKTDVSVWDPNARNWYIIQSSTGILRTKIDWGSGALGDIAAAGDYDGDGKTDIAVWRPSEGNWYIIQSSNGAVSVRNWGGSGDIPVPADYDGDRTTDLAVYRPSEGNWYVVNSGGGVTIRNWGASTDKPVVGDYDGDGKADFAVYRPSEGNWYIVNSATATITVRTWGNSTDKPVEGDYDGDGKTDIAVYRPSEGNWYIINSATATVTLRNFGMSTDVPVPGDYDGDRKTDIAVYRPSTTEWYLLQSSNQTIAVLYLGGSGDMPVPNTYLPQ